jgi:LmbE family N-acetylglucosaminyl deacetylase
MQLINTNADLYIPDQLADSDPYARTTHLGIGAHQDDLEFMALHGILECFQQASRWFGGVTCTDGAGSARSGPYADYSDAAMKAVRVREQRAAAQVGQFSFMAQLAHPSSVAKEPAQRGVLVDDLEQILRAARPDVVYTHNPFDKHATHIGILLAVMAAIRRLPKDMRPRHIYGCEVWRGLDWLPDASKVVHNLDAHPNLAAALNGVFDSQITGGKRYDLAVEGRRRANATFFDSHSVDHAERVAYAVDLSGLVEAGPTGLRAFCERLMDAFRTSVAENLPESTDW